MAASAVGGAASAPGGSFASAAALAVFALSVAATVLLVLLPASVPLPRCGGRAPPCLPLRLRLHWAAAPVLGVAAGVAAGAIDGRTLARGILGDESMQPYGIVLLFMGLAYISGSLDSTGLFAWLALHLTRLSGGRGLALFLLYFALSSLATVFTSNDITTMTLTPIIHYFAGATGADPRPFLAAEFTAANTWSMLLFVGNPTNIIVALAYGMSFATYSRWMALPTLAAGLSCFAVLLAEHRRSIPRRLSLPDVDPRRMLVDPVGAALGAANVLGCLALLAAAPSLKWQLWAVTLACAGLQAGYNLLAYGLLRHRWCRHGVQAARGAPVRASRAPSGAGVSGSKDAAGCPAGAALELVAQVAGAPPERRSAALAPLRGEALLPPPPPPPCGQLAAGAEASAVAPAASVAVGGGPAAATEADLDVSIRQRRGSEASGSGEGGRQGGGSGASAPVALGAPPLPSFWRLLLLLPWEVVPFTLGMFVLVEGLHANGWVDALAAALARAVGGSTWAALLVTGALSTVLANVANNQPMTILMARVVLSPALAGSGGGGGGGVPLAAAFAVVAASNVAANFTAIGALAGIMFLDILKHKGLRLSFLQFSRLMLPAGLASMAAALAVLGAEFSLSRQWQ